MKTRNVKLEYYVLYHDFNTDKITTINIFYDGLIDVIKKAVKKKEIVDFKTLKEFLTKWGKYNYWSKTEYEILVSGLFTKKDPDKIDIWKQIEMNIDLITNYVNSKLEIY